MSRVVTPVSALVLAGVCWGTSFGVAALLDDANPMLITGVRFGLFGVMSIVLLGRSGGFSWIPWRVALLHAAGGSVGLYLSEVFAIEFAGPGPTIAIVGSIPVVYAVIGARRDGVSLRPLAPSLFLTALSHVVIHSSSFADTRQDAGTVLLGLVIAVAGVAGFCTYALHTTNFLRSNSTISATRWASAIGVACGVWSVPLLAVGVTVGGAGGTGRLLLGGAFLALVPSWTAATLWSRGVVDVPRALAGQLLVVEPLAAFVFVHLATATMPGTTLVIGELLLLGGALLAVRMSGRVASEDYSTSEARDGYPTASKASITGSSEENGTEACRSVATGPSGLFSLAGVVLRRGRRGR